MASLVLGAVGAYFGGQWGYMIGSALGGYIDTVNTKLPGQQGPRLGDLKVQSSQYGNPVPHIYGTMRVAGNVIWAMDIVETAHDQTQGGKGGQPQQTTTSYTYSQSFAVSLCDGPIMGIRKIWANGKLIYNMGADATPATIIASGGIAIVNPNAPFAAAAAGQTGTASVNFRVYTGTETQTADSLIEAHVGAGNTPAYRGTAYVVFENLQLGDYGNRMPNLEFEVVQSGTLSAIVSDVASIAATNATDVVVNGHYAYVLNYSIYADIYIYDIADPTNMRLVNTFRAYPSGNSGSNSLAIVGGFLYVLMTHTADQILVLDISDPASPSNVTALSLGSYYYPGSIAVNGSTAYVVDRILNVWHVIDVSSPVNPRRVSTTAKTNIQFFTPVPGRDIAIMGYSAGVGLDAYDTSNPQYPTLVANLAVGSVASMEAATNTLYCADGTTGNLRVYDITTITSISLLSTTSEGFTSPSLRLTGNSLLIFPSSASHQVKAYDVTNPSAPSLLVTSAATYFTQEGLVLHGGYLFSTDVLNNLFRSWFFARDIITPADVSLDSVVSNLCTRASLTAGQIDVTGLAADTISGYFTQRSTARSQIEPLMQSYYFDAVESDGKVKFVKRGGSSVAAIAEDDLAAHVYGSNVPDNLTIDRRQELELPAEVNVQYLDVDAAHLVNSQRSQRLITDSQNKLSINFAISMTASKAKQVSDVLMYDSWTARTAFTMANSWKYSYLEPTDVVTITKGSHTYTARITDEDAASGVFSRGAVTEDSAIYTQTANAASQMPPTTTVAGIPFIDLVLMDIPLLRDQDDGVGFYAAACSFSGGWTGAQAYKSTDGGLTWNTSGRAFLSEATVGYATTVLGDFSSGNFFDELNSVTVRMVHGALASDTELNVLNGANACLVGSEVMQFKNAALVAANTYTLTGLLRGRRGTEWAMSTHVANDRFVLLTPLTTYLMDSSSAEYNLAREYKGVAFGGFLDDASVVNFTNTAVAQECYSPAQLGGGRNAANDVTLNWVRRTRLGGAWNDYADVPLGETSEAYVVEIYSSGTYATLKRTISGLTSPTTVYTAAQQTADGLTPGNPVYFIAYQVSALVGAGYGARGVV